MQTVAYLLVVGLLLMVTGCAGQEGGVHSPLSEGTIPVSRPGNCDKPGATYMLTRDITSDGTAIFLGKDVTLDLNGYTITYAAGPYEHIPNGDFENDFEGWDVSKAPRAKIRHCGGNWEFTGEKVCRLLKGDEIISPYVKLPVANRSYYAMCGVLTNYAKLTVAVEDERGDPVEYQFVVRRGDRERTYKTCPTTGSTILDGGFVFAHFRGKPAGRYRVRVRAEQKETIVDGIDIRPVCDVGVAIVGKTWIFTDHRMIVRDKHMPCFVDYTVEGTSSTPVDSIANAAGSTEITIRNGTIRNGFEGMQSWGIQALGIGGTVNLENLRIISSGINTNAVFVPNAKIKNCRFETNTPFIIERHSLKNSSVAVYRSEGSEISDCEFVGGQGNLCVTGQNALVHDNLFVNRQRVVNHYAISLGNARGVKVYKNRFEPEIGCGINVYRSKECEIYENTFKVAAVDRNCAFYNGGGTMVGVRVSDYADRPNAPRGAWGNNVHHNKFYVKGKQYRTFGRRAAGRVCAIFSSTGAGVNHVTDNEITIEHEDPNSRAMAVAFYIGSSPNAGVFANNVITSNVTPVYLGVGYGRAGKAILKNNTFIKAKDAARDFHPFAMGYWDATELEFRSNEFRRCDFGIRWDPDTHPEWKGNTYDVYWTLGVKVTDAGGKGAPDTEVVILDKDGKEVVKKKTAPDGTIREELLEYKASATKPSGELEIAKEYASPYTVKVGAAERTVELSGNTEIEIRLE